MNRYPLTSLEREYLSHIQDLMDHDKVRSMSRYTQHGDTSCLEHSLQVSFTSFRMARRLGLDAAAAARGGLLHDFFLYDWHEKKKDSGRQGLHAFTHPKAALANARAHFPLGKKEEDIIVKHMWPVTLALPRYRESYLVILADKWCAMTEVFAKGRNAMARIFRVLQLEA